ncbi:MAG TPA: response regulator [bacterium]|nr:response regulator [bacterium]
MPDLAALILLIDADDDRRRSLGALLKESGYATLTAGDAQEALETLAEHPGVEGLVVSWHLPEVNGLKLIRQAMKGTRYEGAVVLYDCPKPQFAEEKLGEWAEDRGLDYLVLEDPSDEAELLEALEDVLSPDVVDSLTEEDL